MIGDGARKESQWVSTVKAQYLKEAAFQEFLGKMHTRVQDTDVQEVHENYVHLKPPSDEPSDF